MKHNAETDKKYLTSILSEMQQEEVKREKLNLSKDTIRRVLTESPIPQSILEKNKDLNDSTETKTIVIVFIVLLFSFLILLF